MRRTGNKLASTAAIVAALAAPLAWGHGPKAHDSPSARAVVTGEEKPYGRPGEREEVSRTVDVDMSDGMRFAPVSIEVRKGETVRFVVRNSGKVLHEMVIGTPAELDAHAALMRRFPGMEHDEPNMTHVDPGDAGEIIWQFTQAGDYRFACLIPGHFDAGMVGSIRVVDGRDRSTGK